MVDDLLAINKCGLQSIKVNTTINSMIELKKLQFHLPEENKPGKCNFMHIGKPNKSCPGMKVHGLNAGEVTEARYLGDLIRNDGKNLSNIRDRVRNEWESLLKFTICSKLSVSVLDISTSQKFLEKPDSSIVF